MEMIQGAWRYAHAMGKKFFPEHQIYFRTNGNVRFLTVTTRAQVTACSVALLLMLWLAGASLAYFMHGMVLSEQEAALVNEQRQLAQMRSRVQALNMDMQDLKGGMATVIGRFEQRTQFLQQLFNHKLKVDDSTAKQRSNGADAAAAARALAGAPRDQQAMVKSFDRYQLAFVEKASRAADSRYDHMDRLLRRMGLRARDVMAQSNEGGVGGPLVRASFERGAYSTLEPQFKDLFLSWTRLDLLQRAMLSIPSFIPVKNFYFTSGFGYRYDPFTGGGAMHAGVDLAGNYGSQILAAATGVVTRTGWVGGYGNMIEIDHGRGMTTRYGHLSAIHVREGAHVTQGDVIGAMGSTGRSTGTHLHFEVRLNGEAVNPMPFLEAARDVLEIQQRSVDAGGPIPDGQS